MFDLQVTVTHATIASIKLALCKLLPEVKSSHRCEAAARGLGFRTYASCLAASREGTSAPAKVSGAEFSCYLALHDFSAPGSHLYTAVAQVVLANIRAVYPHLCVNGFGSGPWNFPETRDERKTRFAQERDNMTGPRAVDGFLASLAFLARVERTQTVRSSAYSYRLKHLAEDMQCTYPGGEKLGPVYVPNGAFIAAALHAGFKVKPELDSYGRYTRNATFNIGKASVGDLDCEIRPDGYLAEQRRRLARARELRRVGASAAFF